ncbi:MAG: DUF5666 domain-containing protein [Microgenomates group bacterium]
MKRISILSLILTTLILENVAAVKAVNIPSPARIRTENEERNQTPITPSPVRLRIEEETQAEVGTSQGELQEKIKEIREAVKEKVRERLEEVKRGVPRAYVGEITQIGEDNFTLEARRQTVQVKVTSETKIIGKEKQTLELKDLKVGDFSIAMGYPGENGTLEAKRIVVVSKPSPSIREVAFGRVTDISSEEKILTLKNERKGLTYTVVVTEKTIITKKVDTKIEKVKFSSIEIGDRVVAIGTPKENEAKLITAKIIHVIPGKALGQVSPSPTPKE